MGISQTEHTGQGVRTGSSQEILVEFETRDLIETQDLQQMQIWKTSCFSKKTKTEKKECLGSVSIVCIHVYSMHPILFSCERSAQMEMMATILWTDAIANGKCEDV
jgi:hypothetical protein